MSIAFKNTCVKEQLLPKCVGVRESMRESTSTFTWIFFVSYP